MGRQNMLDTVCFVTILFILALVFGCSNDEQSSVDGLIVSSPAFNDLIPIKYTCDGEDISPPLEIKNIPEGTRSLTILMYDPDANDWVHWVAYNIEPENKIEEGLESDVGVNTWGTLGYRGPCPPEKHRYLIEIYALDNMLNVKEPTMDDVKKAMEGHIIAMGSMRGEYER